MANRPDQFPLDLTGKSPRNLVQNEERTFTTYNDRIFVPSAGVYYTESMIIHDKATGRRLRPITDYKCLHLHEEASLESGLQACCVVIVHNEEIRNIKFNYQVPGGHYSETLPALRKLLEGVDFQSLTRISWGTQVYGKPETFPAAAHKHPGSEFGDWKRFHVALNNIYHALLHKDHAAWQAVYDYIDASVRSNTQNTLGDNYFTKVELENKLAGLTAPFVSKVYADAIETRANTKIKELTDRLTAEGVKITDLQRLVAELQARDQVKISPDAGNLLEKRENGLYYGIQAPADLSSLYVDCVAGNDDNPGTQALPFKTLDKALRISPRNNSNTISIKWIPPEHQHNHQYEITHHHTVDGCRRVIQVYGHSMSPGGELYNQHRLLGNRDVSNPWLTDRWDPVPVYLRCSYFLEKGTNNKTVRPFTITVVNNGTISFRGVDFIIDNPTDAKWDDGFIARGWNIISCFIGSGKVEIYGSDIVRMLPVDPSGFEFTDPNAPFYKDRYNRSYLATMYGGQNIEINFNAGGYYYGYAPNKRTHDTWPNIGKPVKDRRFDTQAFHLTGIYKGFPWMDHNPGAASALLYTKTAAGGIDGGWYAGGMRSRTGNIDVWMRYYLVKGIVFQNGIQIGVRSTVPLVDISAASGNNAPKAYTEVRESVYRQHFKPNDLYESINTYRSSAEVANVVGYGHWARWGQGLTTVGKGGQASGDQAGMPDFMFLHGIVGGEYAHRLTIAEMPNHKHRFVADDSSNGFPGSVRTGRAHGQDFSQKSASGPAFEYFTPTMFPAESGGDQPHNNIQPSVAVDRWVRLVSNDGQHYTGLNIVNGQFQLTTTADYSTDTWMDATRMSLAGITVTNTGSWEIHSIKLVQPSGDNPNTRIHVRLKCKIPEVLSTHMLFGHTEDYFVWKVPNSHPRWGWQRSIDAEGLTEFVFAVREVVPTQPAGGETQSLPDGSTITLPATGGRLLKPNTRYKVVSQNQSRLAFYAK